MNYTNRTLFTGLPAAPTPIANVGIRAKNQRWRVPVPAPAAGRCHPGLGVAAIVEYQRWGFQLLAPATESNVTSSFHLICTTRWSVH